MVPLIITLLQAVCSNYHGYFFQFTHTQSSFLKLKIFVSTECFFHVK